MKYCIYFPCVLNKDNLINAKTENDLYAIFNNYITLDNDLDNKLSIIKNFLRPNSNNNLSLLKHNNKIFSIIIERNDYRPFEILSVISDIIYCIVS